MIAGLSPFVALWLGVAIFAASWVRGYSGFGSAAIFLALAMVVTDPLPLIPATFLMDLAMTAVQGRGVLPYIDWRRTLILTAGATLGLPVAIVVLVNLPADGVRLVIAGIILIFALLILSGWRLKRTPGPAALLATGITAGFANGGGIGGLPVATVLAAGALPAAAFRATMVAFLTLMDLISLPVMAVAGLVTRDTFLLALAGLPLVLVGTWLGSQRFKTAPPGEFRRFTAKLLIVLALAGAARAVL